MRWYQTSFEGRAELPHGCEEFPNGCDPGLTKRNASIFVDEATAPVSMHRDRCWSGSVGRWHFFARPGGVWRVAFRDIGSDIPEVRFCGTGFDEDVTCPNSNRYMAYGLICN